MADKDKEERSLLDELRYMLSLPEKVKNKDWDGIYDRDGGSESDDPAAETDNRIAERAHDRLYQQKGVEGVFESVTDKFQPKTAPVKTETSTVLPENTGGVGDKKTVDLLEKLLGGPDPYGAKKSGFGMPQVPDAYESDPEAENEPDEQSGAGVPDVEVNGYIEALRGILDPDYAARASEDVMGQYAAMTGGRPSSAAISAGTAARADAEATLLRELLSGGDTQSGESGGLLSGLLGEDTSEGDAYADWVAPLLEGKDGLFNEQEVELLVSYMPALVKELEAEYPSDYAYRVYYLIQSMFDNGNITESTYSSLLRQTGLDGFIG